MARAPIGPRYKDDGRFLEFGLREIKKIVNTYRRKLTHLFDKDDMAQELAIVLLRVISRIDESKNPEAYIKARLWGCAKDLMRLKIKPRYYLLECELEWPIDSSVEDYNYYEAVELQDLFEHYTKRARTFSIHDFMHGNIGTYWRKQLKRELMR